MEIGPGGNSSANDADVPRIQAVRRNDSEQSLQKGSDMNFLAGLILIAAAVLEVGGDAVIRLGLRTGSPAVIVAGGVALGGYGLVVNLVKWDFSRLLGVYVAVFAVVSVLTGRFLFKEVVPLSTWLGLAVIVAGGLVIQLGQYSRGQ